MKTRSVAPPPSGAAEADRIAVPHRARSNAWSPFDVLAHACEDAVLLVDAAGNILRTNAAADDLFGATPEPAVRPRTVRRLFAPCDTRADALLEQLRQDGHATGPITVLQADGDPAEANVSVTCCEDAGAPSAVVVIRHGPATGVAPRGSGSGRSRPVHGQVAGVEAAATELTRFAPSLAHDLLSPISTLGGFARALQRTLGDGAPERSQHYVRRILAAVEQLEHHVQALLSLARASRAPRQPSEVDLTARARAVLQDLQLRDLDRVVQVTVEEGMRAEGDASLLQIVLENLLGNAWKFTARKPAAIITVGTERASDGTIVYRVCDNGDGFDMAHAGKLFRDFQRLHSQAEFPGSGVGLANVHRIVSRHGGTVWARSERGKGATFYFTLGHATAPGKSLVPPRRPPLAAAVRAEVPA